MERYLRKNRLSAWMDAMGLRMLILLLGIGWFVWLWGLGLPALLAGLALGMMGQMLLSRWRSCTLAQREAALRRGLGGELLLEEMLLSPARQAHFQAAFLLAEKYPLVLQRVTDDGVLCRSGDETLLIACLRIAPQGELSAADMIACQRACRQHEADRGVLCCLGRVNIRTAAQAETGRIPLRIIRREELIALAGAISPASDEQLIALGQRRRPRRKGKTLPLLLQREKAGRYMLYGWGFMALYILTAIPFYPVPGAICLALGTMCRCQREQRQAL